MTRNSLIFAAALGSFALLAAAFLFQSLGWAPCKMCLWQRWPHAAAILIGIVALALGTRALAWFGALAVLVTAGIAAFHSGVERGWWEGPASCTGSGPGLGGLDGSSLLPGAGTAEVIVLCDTLRPFLLGLTMANWNLIASLVLAAVWIAAARRA